jgi:hypothetical protein
VIGANHPRRQRELEERGLEVRLELERVRPRRHRLQTAYCTVHGLRETLTPRVALIELYGTSLARLVERGR